MIPTLTTAAAAELPAVLANVLVPLQLFSGQFLYYAVVFFVLAIVAALVGARGVAGITMEVARIFVLIFLVLAIVSLIF